MKTFEECQEELEREFEAVWRKSPFWPNHRARKQMELAWYAARAAILTHEQERVCGQPRVDMTTFAAKICGMEKVETKEPKHE